MIVAVENSIKSCCASFSNCRPIWEDTKIDILRKDKIFPGKIISAVCFRRQFLKVCWSLDNIGVVLISCAAPKCYRLGGVAANKQKQQKTTFQK